MVGNFDCIGGGAGHPTAMTDLAVSSDGGLVGVAQGSLFQIQLNGTSGSTVHCQGMTLTNPSNQFFYGLSYVPAGVLDASKEMLVAANTAGELWAIDATGNLTQHGMLGTVPANDGRGHLYANVGQNWELSGDIVFVANGGDPIGFATVRDCPTPPSTAGCNMQDTLLQIDMSKLASATTGDVSLQVRGLVVPTPTCADQTMSHYGGLYGVAVYQNHLIAFSHGGYVLSIDTTTAQGCVMSSSPVFQYSGAGITTAAPVIKP
jgi:hypothetical protein